MLCQIFLAWIRISRNMGHFIPQIYYLFNRIWFIQILICILYCAKQKRILPSDSHSKHLAVTQFRFFLLMNILVYSFEIVHTGIIFYNFDSFVHHIFAILIFIFSYLEQNVICVFYLLPYLMHTLYWSLQCPTTLLFIYNLSLVTVTMTIIFVNHYWSSISLRIPLVTLCLAHTNLFSYFYDDYLYLEDLGTYESMRSMILSSFIALPTYFYLYRNKRSTI